MQPPPTPEATGANREQPMRGGVLVLGATGLIGSAIARRLSAEGWRVRALGRDAAPGARILPAAEWVAGDLRRMTRPQDWTALLDGVDAVVNAAGALQDGPRDDLTAAHHHAIAALAKAAGGRRFVQISAPGARADAATDFYRTKAAGDAAIKASALDWTILRPGLVIGAQAYGGTALIRMLAAFPGVQPLWRPDARIQTVALADVVAAVAAALRGETPGRLDADLVAATPTTLRAVIAAHRRWLGFAPARHEIRAPDWAARLVGLGADMLGRLGWRSPLRSNALAAIEEGVTGDPSPWRAAGGPDPRDLDATLADIAPREGDRLAARMSLLAPALIALLSAFWLISGLVGALRLETAAETLRVAGWSASAAKAAVLGGAAADMALGAAVLWRPAARMACLGMIAVTAAYLLGASLWRPDLWLDPLGPLVKTLPAAGLALVTRAMIGER